MNHPKIAESHNAQLTGKIDLVEHAAKSLKNEQDAIREIQQVAIKRFVERMKTFGWTEADGAFAKGMECGCSACKCWQRWIISAAKEEGVEI